MPTGIPAWIATAMLCALQLSCASQPPQEAGAGPATAKQIASVNTQLGLGYLQNGQTDLAWERLSTAIQADPTFAMAHNGIALVYDKRGEPEKAETHFKRALALDPTDSATQINYGVFLCEHGRLDEGETYFMQAVENPRYNKPAMAFTNAGLCRMRADDASKAESYFRAALRADPRFPVALLNMAQLSFDSGEYLAARAYMQRYEQVAKHNSRSLWLGIRIEQRLGDKDAVSSLAMLLKANYPDSPETQLLLQSGVQ